MNNKFFQKIKYQAEISWLGMLGLLIALLLLLWLVIVGSGDVSDLKEKTALQKKEIESLEKINSQLLVAEESVEEILANKDKISRLLPTRKGVLNNIKHLEEIAALTGNGQTLRIDELPPDARKKSSSSKKDPLDISLPKDFKSVKYTLSLSGNFSNFMEYLQRFELQPFLTIVNGMTMQAEKIRSNNRESSRNTGIVNTVIEGTFYYIEE